MSPAHGTSAVDRAKGAGDVIEFARILEGSHDGDTRWPRLASVITEMVSAQCCWILLRQDDEVGGLVVHSCGSEGPLSSVALRDLSKQDATFREALATTKSGRVELADESATACRRVEVAGAVIVSVPICIEDARIGTIHVRSAKTGVALSDRHIDTLRLSAFLIGKSLHLSRLQRILRSRFAQLAMMHGSAGSRMQVVQEVVKHPMGVGRLVAKSFYREMTNAGLCSNEIIAIASEIISQLSASLRSRRAAE